MTLEQELIHRMFPDSFLFEAALESQSDAVRYFNVMINIQPLKSKPHLDIIIRKRWEEALLHPNKHVRARAKEII